MAITKALEGNRQNFASNLVRLQKLHNLNNNDLAFFLGISVQMISRYRSGKDFPSFERMGQLCKRFDCTMDELLREA
jgi:transcriptional regulator with XRE-family HTH domain